MTDKQIITKENVKDVLLKAKEKLWYMAIEYLCSERNNCYTKRILKKNKTINILKEKLLRKEQECEELKLGLIEVKAQGDYLNNLALSKTLDTVSDELDQLKSEREKIKAICDNHFDEYEMGCLDLSDAIESLLERYDNAITGLMKQRKELKAENDKLKTYITSFDYFDALSNEQVAVLYTACIDELAIRGYEAKYKTEASVLTRYHNALTEIKEIVTNFYETGFLRTDDDCILINNHLCVETLDKILQKISEVI